MSVLLAAPVPGPTTPRPRPARRLAVLGDSTAVGLGDPLPDGSWRGVGPLLADALGVDRASGRYLNASFTGARMRCVRDEQLPAVLAHRPDVAVLVVGMNDTLRSDFDADRIAADLDVIARSLRSAGALVVAVRFHDHARIFRLPRVLAKALRARIVQLNAAVDRVVARRGVRCYDVGAEPATYELASWSVDRLHPSERGHRLLAQGFGTLIADAGFAVPHPVSMQCAGGVPTSTIDHVGWLVLQGAPWLWRRGRDFPPVRGGACRPARRGVSDPAGCCRPGAAHVAVSGRRYLRAVQDELFAVTTGLDDDRVPETGSAGATAPLAVRMRPRTLSEVVGQQHLLAEGAPLRRLVEGAAPASVVLFGPPGTGKTTLAYLMAGATGRRFEALSALNSGVKDVRRVIDDARRRCAHAVEDTVLFIDEVHRFSKNQQDALLGAVEDRTVLLVAATTENPSFSVVSPLLSRSLVLQLRSLTDDDIRAVLARALADERGMAGAFEVTGEATEHLVRLSGGDARRALTALEAAADAAGSGRIELATVEKTVDKAAVRYDRDGDQHYDVISAFIKSIRGSDVDAALHYLARMIEAGEDPRFIARRLVVHASEDIGMADPTALQSAVAAAHAVQFIGMPEGRLALAQATVHLATAPKSNAVIKGIDAALADVRAGKLGTVPPHLRDGHYAGAARLGNARGYAYPHDAAEGVLRQQYPPDELVGTDYYDPTEHGAERVLAERVPRLRRAVRDE